MKRREIIEKITEELGGHDTDKIIAYASVHTLVRSFEELIEELGDGEISKKYEKLMETIESQRMKFQEEELEVKE